MIYKNPEKTGGSDADSWMDTGNGDRSLLGTWGSGRAVPADTRDPLLSLLHKRIRVHQGGVYTHQRRSPHRTAADAYPLAGPGRFAEQTIRSPISSDDIDFTHVSQIRVGTDGGEFREWLPDELRNICRARRTDTIRSSLVIATQTTSGP